MLVNTIAKQGSAESMKEDNDYLGELVFGKTIGQGEFGIVKEAIHELTGEKVAVKIIEKSAITERRKIDAIKKEFAILKKFRHPHVAQLYNLIETDGCFYLVMEYCSGGDLFDYIVNNGSLSEVESSKLFLQLLSGLEHIHQSGVAHRDLKPENILMDSNNNIKIIDFGLSSDFREGQMLNTICGSPNYVSPEMVNRQSYDGFKVDIWSSGVILFAMLCGYLPFQDVSMTKLKEQIRFARYEIPDDLNSEAKDLIANILIPNPSQRLGISEIRNHQWFQNSDSAESDVNFCIKKQIDVCHKTLEILENDFGIEKKECEQELKDNLMTNKTLSYYLIINKTYIYQTQMTQKQDDILAQIKQLSLQDTKC